MESENKINEEVENKKAEAINTKKKRVPSNIEGKIDEKSEEYYNDNSKLSNKEEQQIMENKDKKSKTTRTKDDLEIWKKINIKSILTDNKIYSDDQGI